MTLALVAGCSVLGAGVGAALAVPVARVPARLGLRARPHPEVAASLRSPSGWALVVVTAALFGATAARFGAVGVLPAYLGLAAGLVALSAIDLATYLLPNRIVFPLAGFVAVALGLGALVDGTPEAFGRALLAGAVAFVAYALLHLASPRGLGFGDVKLAFVLGLALGYLGWAELVLGLFLGFLFGAVVGVGLLVARRRTRRDHVPFGPFMAAGACTAILVGAAIIDWWRP